MTFIDKILVLILTLFQKWFVKTENMILKEKYLLAYKQFYRLELRVIKQP